MSRLQSGDIKYTEKEQMTATKLVSKVKCKGVNAQLFNSILVI